MGRKKTPLSRQLADIDLKLLRVFKAVVDAGGFTAAEVELNIATSTISNYMSDLEKRLDMRLCTRGRAGFSVTEQGRVVYDATQELIEALEQFRNRINTSHDQLLGDLHLGIAEQTIYIRNNGIVDALREFHELAPNVRVHLHTMTAEDIHPALVEGFLQVGVSVLLSPQSQLLCTPLFEEHMSLYCGRGHDLFGTRESESSLQQLNQSSFIESSRMRSGLEHDPDMAGWRKQASALDQEARVALLLTGKFVGFLPEHVAQQPIWRGELHRLFPQRFGYVNTYQLMTRPQQQDNPIVEQFTSILLRKVLQPERPVLPPM